VFKNCRPLEAQWHENVPVVLAVIGGRPELSGTLDVFRRTLEEGLRQQGLEGGQPLARLRNMAAFDRFLPRKEPEAWIASEPRERRY
jgi:hypothetical protein